MTEQEFISFMGHWRRQTWQKRRAGFGNLGAVANPESGHGSTSWPEMQTTFWDEQLIREYLARKYLGQHKQVPEENGRGRERNAYNTADFRICERCRQCVADHSAYLLGAMNGSKQRYAGLKGNGSGESYRNHKGRRI